MNQELLLKLAKQTATLAHVGQFRRDGVTPYIKHPEAVADNLALDDWDGRIVAWLHDVIEDGPPEYIAQIHQDFPPHIWKAVVALTKVSSQNYEDYLQAVKADPLAKRVKIADMLANLQDSPTKNQVRKYADGLHYLLS